MKCPKCGRKAKVAFNDKVICLNCAIENNLVYQQRLDKVLEKFDKFGERYCTFRLQGTITIDYNYVSKEFELSDSSEDITLSLDTVEHLIADMEAQE